MLPVKTFVEYESPPAVNDIFLLETGGFFLLEGGGYFLLNS
jgi:hypothetical protein